MSLFSQNFDPEFVFHELFNASTEEDLDKVLSTYPEIFNNDNWKPLGGNYSNYGVVKNQQAAPIAALIEKITNSIDAILTRKCLEKDCDPKSEEAPNSMDQAIDVFFPDNKNWDLSAWELL